MDITRDFKLTCKSSYEVKWYYSKGTLPKNVELQGNTLIIKHAQMYNEGRYVCTGDTDEIYPWSGNKVQFAAYTFLKLRCKLK